jgi:multiple sugar transport system ATP-binding protein
VARLTFEDVGKRYGSVAALTALDLDVGDGEAVCVLGPSGSGKSTALRLAAGLEQVTAGRVLIDGTDVTSRPAAQRDISMVFQSYALFPHLDVAGNIGFGLAVRKVPKHDIRRRVGEIAELVGCGHLLQRRPDQLSGGERQRVALARAMIRQPAILLLDEPLSNLDPSLRADMRVELRRLHDSAGTTMVHVTHDQVEALTVGDRVAIVRDGRLEQTGSPDVVYRRPANRFVATFIGSPRMNVLPVVRTAASIRAGPFTLPARLAPEGELCAGIRADQLVLVDDGGVSAQVDLIEGIGDAVIAHLVAGSHRLVAKLGARVGLRTGDRVEVAAAADRWYLFDNDSGRTVRFAS